MTVNIEKCSVTWRHADDSKYRQLLSNMAPQRKISFVDYYITPKEIYFYDIWRQISI